MSEELLKEMETLRDGLLTLGHTYWGNKAVKIIETYKEIHGKKEPIG